MKYLICSIISFILSILCGVLFYAAFNVLDSVKESDFYTWLAVQVIVFCAGVVFAVAGFDNLKKYLER